MAAHSPPRRGSTLTLARGSRSPPPGIGQFMLGLVSSDHVATHARAGKRNPWTNQLAPGLEPTYGALTERPLRRPPTPEGLFLEATLWSDIESKSWKIRREWRAPGRDEHGSGYGPRDFFDEDEDEDDIKAPVAAAAVPQPEVDNEMWLSGNLQPMGGGDRRAAQPPAARRQGRAAQVQHAEGGGGLGGVVGRGEKLSARGAPVMGRRQGQLASGGTSIGSENSVGSSGSGGSSSRSHYVDSSISHSIDK